MVSRRLAADPTGFPLGRRRAHAEETEIGVVGRHDPVHLQDSVEVAESSKSDLDSGAIGEQRVNADSRLRAHAILPGCAAA